MTSPGHRRYTLFITRAGSIFSNDRSRHIEYAKNGKKVAASIFHDSDDIQKIFGFQMAGTVQQVSQVRQYLGIVKKYVLKFNFLEKVFGSQIVENRSFFQEKFKSHLFEFSPDAVFLSDNSKTSGKRSPIDLDRIS